MSIQHCALCCRKTEFKRVIGVGTLLLVLLTGGVFLLAIPFFTKCCSICGATNQNSNNGAPYKTSTVECGVGSNEPENIKVSKIVKIGLLVLFLFIILNGAYTPTKYTDKANLEAEAKVVKYEKEIAEAKAKAVKYEKEIAEAKAKAVKYEKEIAEVKAAARDIAIEKAMGKAMVAGKAIAADKARAKTEASVTGNIDGSNTSY